MIKSNILVRRFGIKDFDFYAYATKEYFKKGVLIAAKVGVAPERTRSLKKCRQKQKNIYGIKQRITGII